MFHSLLPKLPSLYQSLQKYLKVVQLLVNDEESEKTPKAEEEYGNGTG